MKWPQKNLGDLAIVSSGDGAPQDASDFGNSGLPFVRAGSLSLLLEGRPESELELIPKAISSNRRMNIFPAKTVLFAKSGMSCTKGLVYQLKSPAHVVNHLAAIQCGNDLDSRFLLRWFEANSPARLIANEAYPSIKISDIRAEKIPLPPLPEQKRIAAILDKADSLRTKRLETIKQLDKLARAVFIEMFGDPVTNPKGLKKEKLEKVCDRVIDCPHSTPNWSQSGVICLRTSNLGKGEWNWSDTRYVTEEEYQQRVMRSTIEPNDIILSREGTVGVVAIVSKGMRLCMGQRLVQLRVMESLLNPVYLLHLLIHDLAPERLSRLMAGSTSKHLNVRELRQLPLLLPPLHLQQRFASIITSIQNHKTRRQTQLAELDTLFTSLQARAFKGEL